MPKLTEFNSWPCPGCRDRVALTRTQRLRAHDDLRTGQPCPGKGFCIDEDEYPQLIKLWGWETGQRLMKQQSSGRWVLPWESGPYAPGVLQDMIMKAYPGAAAFGLMGTRPDEPKGITFCVSKRRWYFAAPDGHVGEGYTSRSDAMDAYDEYMKEASS